jgi:DNA polymerase II large subunit
MLNEKTQKYFENLKKEVDKVYSVATDARKKGFDPIDEVEIPLAMSMAEKVVSLISTIYPQMKNSGITKRILELEEEYGKLDPAICLQIAEEIAKQKFCEFKNILEAIDAGVRVGFAYITLGVVSSPIEGYTGIKTRKTRDGKDYIEASFSGPIRSASGTGSAFSLVIIDHLREIFGFAKYDSTEDEIKRTAAELADYHERITNLQYMPTEEETFFLTKNLPIQVNGEPSENLEVSNYKNLERVETNLLRSGFCLVMSEGIAQKAAKIKRYVTSLRKKGFKLTDWDFLDGYLELHEKREKGKTDSSPTYIKDIIAGRPIFSHPSQSGGFRFRYGRGRNSGFSAAAINPATMAITDNFIAIGTQLKIEKPTKGCAVAVCDKTDGPIVKFFNGSVRKIKTKEEAEKIYDDVEEIIYLGDVLFPFSDVVNRNAILPKSGYVEEWWSLDLKEKSKEIAEKTDPFNVSFEDAVKFSEKFKIPLHPSYIYYWTQISKEQFLNLIEWLEVSKFKDKIILPYTRAGKEKYSFGKRALELLGVQHDVSIENVVIDLLNSKTLLINFGIDYENSEESKIKDLFSIRNFISGAENSEKSVLEIINSFSEFEIKDKAGDFIGARMGRPEKAKLRKLVGSPNVLFPVGSEGGRLRSVQAAYNLGFVKSTFPIFYCENCKKETIYKICETCDSKTKKMYYFYDTREKLFENQSKVSKEIGKSFASRSININDYFDSALKKLGITFEEAPALIKGVRGLFSDSKIPENLVKGFLRAKYGLQVNKDGTIRMDATELPLTSFKPKEIRTSVEKLKELGYEKDIEGNFLENENQIVELMPHDILIPDYLDSADEKGGETFVKICNFIDDMLVNLYGLESYYNVKTKEDLIGKLGVCMAPHNCAGVICRFIGFSSTLGLMASPYMHAAVRRDCDGDEASIMLLGDVLINFSRYFLSSHRGGTQDAPLVLNAKIDAGEVDDQILDFENVNEYPLELYKFAEQRKHSSEIKIHNIKMTLREGKDPFIGMGFTHDTTDFNKGVACSSYKRLGLMSEKIEHQMKLVEKIRAADTKDTARLVIDRHFMRDIRGNLRSFSNQTFRCVACNEIFRRVPLSGVCTVCGGKLIFTINEGGIRKYLEIALELAKKYNLSIYMQQNLDLVKKYVDSVFGKESEKQEKLAHWF